MGGGINPNDLDDLDLPRLLLVGSGLYSGMTTIMHPLNVMKTRAQSLSSTQLTRYEQVRAMVGKSGIRGLWAGLGPVLAGAVPARAGYILALEGVRPPADTMARKLGADGASASAIANGLSGLAAAMASMVVYVPADVVSQKMMIESKAAAEAARAASSKAAASSSSSSAVAVSPGFLEVVREIVATNGWRGLYRGMGISMVIGLPAGSIWWAAYGASREALPSHASLQALPELAHKAIASTIAAACVVGTVAPFDTIKTHHQLAVGTSETTTSLFLRLVGRDGFLSLYAGSTPRFVHLSLWSTALICIYEELKRTCRKQAPMATIPSGRAVASLVRRLSDGDLVTQQLLRAENRKRTP